MCAPLLSATRGHMHVALLATIHLYGLVVALPSLFRRGLALHRLVHEPTAIDGVFAADRWWGLGSLLLLLTGLIRFARSPAYYLVSGAFQLKMALFIAISVVELWPMITLIRWRIQLRGGQPIDTSASRHFWKLNALQIALVAAIPFIASMLARGIGATWFS